MQVGFVLHGWELQSLSPNSTYSEATSTNSSLRHYYAPSSILKSKLILFYQKFPGCNSMGADRCFILSFTCWLYHFNLAHVPPLLAKRKSPRHFPCPSPWKAAHLFDHFSCLSATPPCPSGDMHIMYKMWVHQAFAPKQNETLRPFPDEDGGFFGCYCSDISLSILKSEIIPSFLLPILFMRLSNYKATFCPNL